MYRLLLSLLLSFALAASAAASPPPGSAVTVEIEALRIARNGLVRSLAFVASRPEIFRPDREGKARLLTRDQKLEVWNTWSSVLDAEAALDRIRRAPGKAFPKGDRDEAKAAADAAFLAGYRYALEFIELAEKNPALDVILNEPVPELGLPEGTYGSFKFRFLNVAVATEFAARQAVAKARPQPPPGPVGEWSEEDAAVIWKMGRGTGHVLTLKNAGDIVRKAGFTTWFPLQKGVSTWMGDTKVARNGSSLISKEQVRAIIPRLLPGDIFFERHEWYLSNLGLPGFWTHAALYVGTPDERRRLFADPEVRSWVRSEGIPDGDFEKLLQSRYPGAYALSIKPEAGNPPRILEAVSEGVVFTTMEHSGTADSLGVIRPRLTQKEKAMALLTAFHYSGRPYDFNFDFETDASLVCSELVYKAYEPRPGMRGMRFPVTKVMGRKVSTPNGIVEQFAAQAGTQKVQADFVLFLDGYEKGRKAVEVKEEEFRRSWQRPNWHILVQKAPEEIGGKE